MCIEIYIGAKSCVVNSGEELMTLAWPELYSGKKMMTYVRRELYSWKKCDGLYAARVIFGVCTSEPVDVSGAAAALQDSAVV